MLTSKQRADLRAQANDLDTTLMVGKGGVTENVLSEAARQLEARIKRLTRAQKDALIADPERLPALCPALAGADIRPVPDAQLTDYLPDTAKPADA